MHSSSPTLFTFWVLFNLFRLIFSFFPAAHNFKFLRYFDFRIFVTFNSHDISLKVEEEKKYPRLLQHFLPVTFCSFKVYVSGITILYFSSRRILRGVQSTRTFSKATKTSKQVFISLLWCFNCELWFRIHTNGTKLCS